MKRTLVSLRQPLVWFGIAVPAILIFAADTVTDLEIAVAVLYVAVVLIAMMLGRPKVVLVVGMLCVGLTIISFIFTPHGSPQAGLVNCCLSILAIVGTTFLAIKLQSFEAKARLAQADLAHMARVMTIGELTASIAHEVSQPLAAIVANASAGLRWLAASPPRNDEAQSALSRILADGDRAGEVIARARRLVTRTPPSLDPVDISLVIVETLALMQNEIRTNQILLRTELASDLPQVFGDGIQLQQVILNYIVNAVEALSGPDIMVRDLLVSAAADGKKITVSVRDTGAGVSNEALGQVFEPFYTTKSTGIGMGLAISRSIIEAHGGTVYVAPNFPRGTVFGFTLPFKVRA